MTSFSFDSDHKASEEIITNDGFFPDVAIAVFQESYRLPLDYSVEVIKRELIMSIAHTNRELKEWREGVSVERLKEVDKENVIDGEHVLSHFYLSAVFSHAKAELLNNFATMQRDEGTKNALEDNPRIRRSLKRDYFKAMSFFKDTGLDVELI